MIGNERSGLSKAQMDICDSFVYIPQVCMCTWYLQCWMQLARAIVHQITTIYLISSGLQFGGSVGSLNVSCATTVSQLHPTCPSLALQRN